MRKVCKWEACEKYRQGSQKSYQAKRESRGDEEMKPEEAKDILSDMRDQHLCFLSNSVVKDEWQERYLKEAWACDSGAKALEKQIPCKPEEYVPDFPYNIFSTQKCAKCGTPVIGKKISKYCSECGQKIDWGEE